MTRYLLDPSLKPERPDADAPTTPELNDVPSGAFMLAGVAVGLLLVAWLFMYFVTFLPRGPVG